MMHNFVSELKNITIKKLEVSQILIKFELNNR